MSTALKTHTESLQSLTAVLAQEPELAFATLVGSRATGKYRPDSDWDIALMWRDGADEWALCSGQLIPDTFLSFSSAATGASPRLKA